MKYRKPIPILMFLFICTGFLGGIPYSIADSTDPLFINLISEDLHRSNMALRVAEAQSGRGHHVTIYLNDKGVFLASTRNASRYENHQKTLGELMTKGVTVYVCPFCMKNYGVLESDLISGVKQSTPELIEASLFKDGSRTLTW
jgi:sulfur relay (sulfurtransferase) complex TusBCD TusD component (DsrE family)